MLTACRFGVIICHDSSFPHVALAEQQKGAELIFSPHYNAIDAPVMDKHRRVGTELPRGPGLPVQGGGGAVERGGDRLRARAGIWR